MESTRDLRWLPRHLTDAGYTADALKRLLGVTYPDDVGPLNHAPAQERLAGDRSPAAIMTRLFFLEANEPERHVASVFPDPARAALVRTGLLQRRGSTLRARLRVDPVGGQYVMADRRFRTCDSAALRLRGRDPVYPPSSDSLMLREAIVAADGAQALDLCTGSGVLAIGQAHGAKHVVAVDINPRAAALARCNAQLNGIDNLDVRLGDLYAPVHQQRFDLIIANPPFVASPYAAAASYHAGGPTGDRVLRRIIAGLGTALGPGGRAFAISHVALRRGTTLEEVAARWFRTFPGRALVLSVETGGPVDLAAAQALFALERGLRAYATVVKRWVNYLHGQRISTVALLLIAAERRGHQGVETVEAQQRVLSLPVSPPPAERIRKWLDAGTG